MAGRTDDFFVDVARGAVPGWSSILVRGSSINLVKDTLEDVWTVGGTKKYLTSAETITVVSTDSEDSSTGGGARILFLEGLDENLNVISEEIILQGLAPVESVLSYLRINRMSIISAVNLSPNTYRRLIQPAAGSPSC